MTDEDTRFTRRSALQLLGGFTAGTAVWSSQAAAESDRTLTTDGNGNEKWILRFRDVFKASDDPDLSVTDAKQLAGELKQDTLDTLSEDTDYEVKNDFWLANAALVTATKDPESARAELTDLSGVESVHRDFMIPGPDPLSEADVLPHDHEVYQYGIPAMNIPDTWDAFNTRGDGVSVAVLDTGIDPDHPDLTLAQDGWTEFDEEGTEIDSKPYDPDGHGTHVSGTVAGGRASGLEGEPHLGVAPEADLYNVKVLDDGGTFTQILAGVEWAVEQGIDVVNMSLGATGMFGEMIEPIQNAFQEGTVVVSSAGNSGAESSGSPGNIFESFAVGASNPDGDITSFSSGELIRTSEDWDADWLTEDWPLNYHVPDVAAPGADVLSTYPDGEYNRLSGTSMASPHVAGAVALAISANPDLRGQVGELQDIFERTAVHGDGPDALPGIRYGEGIIDTLSGITSATDSNTIEGTVLDAAGDPLSDITVESSFGTSAETADDGSYSLLVTDGEWDLSADSFGYQPQTETLQVSGGESVTQDLSLVDGLDVAITSGQPDVIGVEESFNVDLSVANLESILISLSDETTLSSENVSLLLDDVEVPVGESYSLSEPVSGDISLTVEIAPEASPGTVALTHQFDGPGETQNAATGPTDVLEDPTDATLQIVEWDQTAEVTMGETLTPYITVENTGDRTTTVPLQWWLFDPEGDNVFTADVVTLQSGDQVTAEFPIEIPAGFVPPGQTGSHGWIVGDEVVSVSAEFFGSAFSIGEFTGPEQVDYGETLSLTVPYQNVGNAEGSDTVELTFDGVFVGSETISAAPGDSGTATVTFDTSRVVRDRYEYVVATSQTEVSGSVWVGPIQAPPAITENRPQDLSGDGLFEDINGDGVADIFDVQTLYSNLETDVVQDNAEYYNFSGDDPTEVTVFDVQALYERIQQLD